MAGVINRAHPAARQLARDLVITDHFAKHVVHCIDVACALSQVRGYNYLSAFTQ
jgi:hypothetical protein